MSQHDVYVTVRIRDSPAVVAACGRGSGSMFDLAALPTAER